MPECTTDNMPPEVKAVMDKCWEVKVYYDPEKQEVCFMQWLPAEGAIKSLLMAKHILQQAIEQIEDTIKERKAQYMAAMVGNQMAQQRDLERQANGISRRLRLGR
jgi:hypothetical protein